MNTIPPCHEIHPDDLERLATSKAVGKVRVRPNVINSDKPYMLFADNEMNLDDIQAFIDGKKMNIGIFRIEK